MASPIFILGSNRNGTTWLSNIVSSHPKVSAAQHEVHWGIKENSMYNHLMYWGDLRETDALIRFLELYSSGDYFTLVGGNKEYFYQNPPADFIDFFFSLMDQFADQEGNPYWLTKFDPSFYYRPSMLVNIMDRIVERYDNPKFIGIKRNYRDVVKSYVNMQGKIGKYIGITGVREAGILLKTARYVSHYREIESILARTGGVKITFNHLVSGRAEEVNKITSYIDVEFDDAMMADQYSSNSSFKRKTTKNEVPAVSMGLAENALVKVFKTVPSLPCIILRLRDALRPEECPLSWRLLKLNHMADRFESELSVSGRVGLRSVLFENEDG